MKTPRLAEVCKIVNGGTPKSGFSEYWGGDIAWLTPAEMGKRLTPYIGQTARTISRAGLANCSARQVPTGSLIMSTRAPIGHLAIPELPMAFNQGCRGLIPSDALETKYLYYFLWFSRDKLNELGTGTTFKELSSGALGNYRIPLPPVEKQRRIVAVLDDAFAAITTVTANTEKNLANAQDLFASELDDLIVEASQSFPTGPLMEQCERITVGHVGPMKDRYEVEGIPFLRSQNVRPFEISVEGMMFIGQEFDSELKKSRLSPGDVAVVRTGYPGTAAVIPATLPVANCADLVIIRPGKSLNPYFIAAFLNSNIGKRAVSGKLVGAAQKHFNIGSAKLVSIPLPSLEEQDALVSRVSALSRQSEQLIKLSRAKLRYLADLKSVILRRAFLGELATGSVVTVAAAPNQFATPKFTAQVIAFAHYRHERQQSQKTFGHVKAQKALQLTESVGGIDLGRRPIKDAAGPNDFQHMLRATDWAVQHRFFEFVPRVGGTGYDFKKLADFGSMMTDALEATRPVSAALERAFDPIVPMVSQDAEVFTTVHAAWNNLLHDGKAASDDAIVKEARDDWHSAKLKIPEAKFRAAIKSIRAKRLVPDGSAKYVGGQGGLF